MAKILKVSAFHLPDCGIVVTYPKLQNMLLLEERKKNLQYGVISKEKCFSEEMPNWHQGNRGCKTHKCLNTICQDIKNAIPGTKSSITNSRTCQAQGV